MRLLERFRVGLVFPREAKGRHTRKAKPGDHVANDLAVRLVELTPVEGIKSPGGGGRLQVAQPALVATRSSLRRKDRNTA